MAKITVNPRFRWSDTLERFVLIGHDGQYEIPDNEILMRADRGAVQQGKNLGKTSTQQADQYGTRGTTEYNAVMPGLVQEAQHPTGFTPLEKSSMVTSSNEALGGVNSGAAGEARLNAMRTRNASGFAPALAEAARARDRAAASTNLNINMADAQLAREKQDAARRQLEGLYGIDTRQQLGEQGMASQDLQDQLAAGRQGWYQNALAGINTFLNARKAFAPTGTGGEA